MIATIKSIRSGLISFLVLLVCCLLPASANATEPDTATIIKLARQKLLFGLNSKGSEGGARLAEALADGRLPAVVYAWQPDTGEIKPYQVEIDRLRYEITSLQKEMKGAGEERVFEIGRKLEDAKYKLDTKLIEAKKKGLPVSHPSFSSLTLGLVILRKGQQGWAIGRELKLGSYDAKALGAQPEAVDFELRQGDFNNNGDKELAIDAIIELFETESEGETSRTHSQHFLVEFASGGPKITFSLDGGIDSGGRCSSPLDAGLTARYFLRSRSDPAELVVVRSRSECETDDEQPASGRQHKPGVMKYSWSESNSKWHLFDGLDADAYLVTAAAGTDSQQLEQLAKVLARRRLRKKLALGRGYPRVIAGDDLVGLKSDRFVLALGLCREKKQAWSAVRKLRRRLRGRRYRVQLFGVQTKNGPALSLSCPGSRLH